MKPERKKKLWVERKKSEAQIKNQRTTKRKRKTAHDARDFVASFFSKAKISIFNKT
tara:strand:- start:795 stop:962 length:168 start_codon:yes stop_codon:yes gene_type:complete